VLASDGRGWAWDARTPELRPVIGMMPGASDIQLGSAGPTAFWFRGDWPPGLHADDVAALIELARRALACEPVGQRLQHALALAAVRGLRRDELLQALAGTLVATGGYAAALICAVTGDDGVWVGSLAMQGQPEPLWLADVPPPPAAPPYD